MKCPGSVLRPHLSVKMVKETPERMAMFTDNSLVSTLAAAAIVCKEPLTPHLIERQPVPEDRTPKKQLKDPRRVGKELSEDVSFHDERDARICGLRQSDSASLYCISSVRHLK